MKEVEQLIKKSRKFIRSAKLLLKTGDYESAVSRAYYAMSHEKMRNKAYKMQKYFS